MIIAELDHFERLQQHSASIGQDGRVVPHTAITGTRMHAMFRTSDNFFFSPSQIRIFDCFLSAVDKNMSMLRKMITKSKEYKTLEMLIVTDVNETEERTLRLLRNI